MDVLIYGAGGVGLGLASALLESGARVRVVARPDTVAALKKEGLRRSGLFGETRAAPEALEAASSLGELVGEGPDVVLVTVKSSDSASAAADLAACSWIGNAPLVLCQNGWGNAEHFVPHFSPARVFSARVITGFVRHEPQHVEITAHAEPIHVGSLFGAELGPMEPLCRAIAAGGIPCETSAHVSRDLWAKLLYNGLLNPLGALFGVAYGALGESDAARSIMADLAAEIFAVMRASGYDTHWPDAATYLDDFYARLLPPTAKHESSMLQDLRAGRRTEIDAILGVVVELGHEAGVAVPVSETLTRAVRFLEGR